MMPRRNGGRAFAKGGRVGKNGTPAFEEGRRNGTQVSHTPSKNDLDDITPADFTVHTALGQLGDRDPWAARMPAPQQLSADLIEEGHAIPVARVQAMHEGKRRARNRRS